MFISIADGSAQTRIRRINMFLEKNSNNEKKVRRIRILNVTI